MDDFKANVEMLKNLLDSVVYVIWAQYPTFFFKLMTQRIKWTEKRKERYKKLNWVSITSPTGNGLTPAPTKWSQSPFFHNDAAMMEPWSEAVWVNNSMATILANGELDGRPHPYNLNNYQENVF